MAEETIFDPADDAQQLRMVEALLFAAEEPLDEKSLAARLPDGADIAAMVEELRAHYENRGVTLNKVAGKWAFRTSPDLQFILEEHRQSTRKLSRAALETLSIIAYHQPVTRAEIEEVRGVGLSKGTLDLLMEIGWVRVRGRRRTPGRPVTYGTSDDFLDHFGLETVKDLPGLDELKAAGLLEGEISIPKPASMSAPEDLLEDGDDGSEATKADMDSLSLELPEESSAENAAPQG
jgi:segregation and condensation protein B